MQKINILLLLFLLPCSFLFAQIPSFVWANSAGGTSSDLGRTFALDAQGNLYVAGQFSGTVDFDPGPGQENLTSSGASDYFILKLDADGAFIWARQLATGLTSSLISLSVDASGNVFVGGTFSQTGDFDPGPGTYNLTSAGQSDAFLVKLNPQGDFSWAVQIGDTQQDNGNTVVTDHSGNIYLTGRFDGTIDFDPGAGVHSVTSQGSSDGYVLKLDTDGAFQWVAKIEGLGTSEFTNHSLTLDATGNIYLTGSFFGTTDMDPGAGVFSFTSLGNRDVFILKLTPNGSLAWAKQIGGPSVDHSFSIFVDADENVYTCGTFGGNVDFDPGPGTVVLSPTSGGDDHFLLKLDAVGDYVWAKVLNPSCTNIWVNTNQQVFVTGAFLGLTDMDPGAGIFNLSSVNSSFDAFILKLDNNGNFLWAGSAGGAGTDISSDLLIDAGEQIYAVGYFEQTSDFDPDAGAVFELTSSGAEDVFVLKWEEMIVQASEAPSIETIRVFPNPTQQKIQIQAPKSQGAVILSVWDAFGHRQAYYDGQEFELDIAGPPGVYFIQLEMADGGKRVWKVVKQ